MARIGRRFPVHPRILSPYAARTYSYVVLADSPVSYWRLGEPTGTVAADRHGVSAGTYTGGYTLNQAGALVGDSDRAVTFDGTTGYVTVPYAASLNPTGSFSVEAWVNPSLYSTTDAMSVISSRKPTTSGHAGYEMGINAVAVGDGLPYAETGNGTTYTVIHGTSQVPLNQWSHMVTTFDGTSLRLYLNGTLVAGPTAVAVTVNNANPLNIGGFNNGAGEFLYGSADEAAIYGTALSATQISAHYIAGIGSRVAAGAAAGSSGASMGLTAASRFPAGVGNPALVGHAASQATSQTVTPSTSSFDTTGATLLIISRNLYGCSSPTVADSYGNTWTQVTAAGDTYTGIWYCNTGTGANGGPNVGPGHTFSIGGTLFYASFEAAAFSGTVIGGAPEVNTSSGTNSTSVQPGSGTPAANNELLITSTLTAEPTGETIDSGFTITDQVLYVSGLSYGSAMAYQVQSTAAAINPTWTGTGSNTYGAILLSFPAATVAGALATSAGTSSNPNVPLAIPNPAKIKGPYVVKNRILNPSFEYDTLNAFPGSWQTFNGSGLFGVSTEQVQSGIGESGGNGMRFTGSFISASTNDYIGIESLATFPISGTYVQAGAWFNAYNVPYNTFVCLYLACYDASSVNLGNIQQFGSWGASNGWPVINSSTTGAGWLTFNPNTLLPAGTTQALLYVFWQNFSSAYQSGIDFAVDKIAVYSDYTSWPGYMDGDSPGLAWSGTPGASNSGRTDLIAAGSSSSSGLVTINAGQAVAPDASASTSSSLIAITAAMKELLGTSSGASTASATVNTAAAVPSSSSTSSSTSNLAVTATTSVPAGASSSTSTATGSLSATTGIPAGTSVAISAASASLTARTTLPLGASASTSTSSAALTATTSLPTGASASTSTASAALNAILVVSLGASASTSTGSAVFTASTSISAGASASTSTTAASIGVSSLQLGGAASTSTTAMTTSASTGVPAGTSVSLSVANLSISGTTRVPSGASGSTSSTSAFVTAATSALTGASASISSAAAALTARTTAQTGTSASTSTTSAALSARTTVTFATSASSSATAGALSAVQGVSLGSSASTSTASGTIASVRPVTTGASSSTSTTALSLTFSAAFSGSSASTSTGSAALSVPTQIKPAATPVNLVLDPSFEYDTVGPGLPPFLWTEWSSVPTTVEVLAGGSTSGTKSLHMGGTLNANALFGIRSYNAIPITPGPATFGFTVTDLSGALATQNIYAIYYIVGFNVDNSVQTMSVGNYGTIGWNSGSWPQISSGGTLVVSGDVPAGTDHIYIYAGIQNYSAAAVAVDFTFDSLALFCTPSWPGYSDGDTIGWGWTGTPGASASGPKVTRATGKSWGGLKITAKTLLGGANINSSSTGALQITAPSSLSFASNSVSTASANLKSRTTVLPGALTGISATTARISTPSKIVPGGASTGTSSTSVRFTIHKNAKNVTVVLSGSVSATAKAVYGTSAVTKPSQPPMDVTSVTRPSDAGDLTARITTPAAVTVDEE